jgi:hypothetical protein
MLMHCQTKSLTKEYNIAIAHVNIIMTINILADFVQTILSLNLTLMRRIFSNW